MIRRCLFMLKIKNAVKKYRSIPVATDIFRRLL
nr:MAG TPA: hypothetical protein [Inoviridae sp.]